MSHRKSPSKGTKHIKGTKKHVGKRKRRSQRRYRMRGGMFGTNVNPDVKTGEVRSVEPATTEQPDGTTKPSSEWSIWKPSSWFQTNPKTPLTGTATTTSETPPTGTAPSPVAPNRPNQ